jgi:FAD/FMN-containing dehydrogenase
MWKVREAGLGVTAYPPDNPDTHESWEDAAVPPERLGDYLRDFQALLKPRVGSPPACTCSR